MVRCSCGELVECRGKVRVQWPPEKGRQVVVASGKCTACHATVGVDQPWDLEGAE